jgi:hypothetical protein
MNTRKSAFDDYALPLAILGFGLPYLWAVTALIFVLMAAQLIAG